MQLHKLSLLIPTINLKRVWLFYKYHADEKIRTTQGRTAGKRVGT